MTITQQHLGDKDMFCCRCFNLGIPTPTILVGDTYKVIAHEGISNACCEDCFERLKEEINENPETNEYQ